MGDTFIQLGRPVTDPFEPFREFLEWLDSHDGRLMRRNRGQNETDTDLIFLIPTPPTRTIFTVGDLRAVVEASERLKRLEG